MRILGNIAIALPTFALGMGAGCFNPTINEGKRCDPDGLCPAGFVCEPTEERCVRSLQGQDAGDYLDSGPTDDSGSSNPGFAGPPPIVRYFFSEAGDGQTPMIAADSAADPLDLELKYVGFSPHFAQGDSGRLLVFPVDQAGLDTGGAMALVEDTKVDALHGSKTMTMEVVYAIHTCFPQSGVGDSRVFGVGTGDSLDTDGWLSLRVINAEVIMAMRFADEPRWRSFRIAPEDDSPCGVQVPRVEHWVLNTDAENPALRVRRYVDGIEKTYSLVEGPPPLTSRIDLQGTSAAPRKIYVGRSPSESSIRSFHGQIHYAALYSEALTAAQITAHAERLLISDDP